MTNPLGDPPGPGPGLTPNDSISEWALGIEGELIDRRSEAVLRALEVGLLKTAYSYAHKYVGSNDAQDAAHTAYLKAFEEFDPEQGAFPAFFTLVLRTVCLDLLRKHKDLPVLAGDITDWAESTPGAFRADADTPEDEVIRREDEAMQRDIASQVSAAVEKLDLSVTNRETLRRLMDGAVGHTGTDRKRTQRTRDSIDDLAGLTPEERQVVSLHRQHRALDADAQALIASAWRKVLTIFGIWTEGAQR